MPRSCAIVSLSMLLVGAGCERTPKPAANAQIDAALAIRLAPGKASVVDRAATAWPRVEPEPLLKPNARGVVLFVDGEVRRGKQAFLGCYSTRERAKVCGAVDPNRRCILVPHPMWWRPPHCG